jgi:hypothetical protein
MLWFNEKSIFSSAINWGLQSHGWLLGQAGLLEKAFAMIKSMPTKPSKGFRLHKKRLLWIRKVGYSVSSVREKQGF